MKVLHININYTATTLHQTMIEHLNHFEIENKVFVPTYDKNRSVIDCGDYVVLSECYKKRDRLFYYNKQKKIINSVWKLLDVSQFEIIHAYTLFTDGNAAMELSRRAGIPYVVAVRNTDVNYFFKKMIHLRSHGVTILRNASAVFFLSPVYRDTVINRYVPKKYRKEISQKSYVIPNGIDDFWQNNIFQRDSDAIIERYKEQKEVRCIYVGSIDKNKNIELTLRALSKMNAEGWRCTLTSVGKIVDKSEFNKLSTYSFFEYMGSKTKEDLLDFYRNADIFVMPSHAESFGLVYAEAMSQRLPVIYTRFQGFDGQFPEGEVGYAVSDSDPVELAEVVKKICREYSRIVENITFDVRKFMWNDICMKYKEIYQGILYEDQHGNGHF